MNRNDIDTHSFPNVGNNPFYNKEFSVGSMLPQTSLVDTKIVRASIQPYVDGLNLSDYDLTKVEDFMENTVNPTEGLVFLSFASDWNENVIQPRIPDNYLTRNGYEDNTTPRVCFSTSVTKALRALSQRCTGMELYVYTPGKTNGIKVITPTVEQVPDALLTDERWILQPVPLYYVGKIKVIGPGRGPGLPYKYGGDKVAKLYDWSWKWLDKSGQDPCTGEPLTVMEEVEESSMASTIEADHKQKGSKSLGSFKKVRLTDDLRKKYSSDYSFLKHFYGADETHETYAWFDNNDKIVGAVCVSQPDKKFDGQIWLSDFFITHDYRGYGLSEQMLKFATSNCKADALGVAKDNMIARRLYEKNGFKYGKDIGKEPTAGSNLLMYKESEDIITEGFGMTKTLYHGSMYKLSKLEPTGLDLGNSFQRPGWSVFFFDNYDLAEKWAIFQTLRKIRKSLKGTLGAINGHIRLIKTSGNTGELFTTQEDVAEFSDYLSKNKVVCYVYTCKIPVSEIGMGTNSMHNEYTVRRTVVPNEVKTILLTPQLIQSKVTITTEDKILQYKNASKQNARGFSSLFMSRDVYWNKMNNEENANRLADAVDDGLLKPGDDIEAYMKANNIKFDVPLFDRVVPFKKFYKEAVDLEKSPKVTAKVQSRDNPNDSVSKKGVKVDFYNDKGEHIGEASVSAVDTDSPYAYDIEVFSKFRGQHYGHSIMDYLMKHYKVAELGVKTDNEKAINLYKKHGFHIDKKYKWDKEDLYAMRSKYYNPTKKESVDLYPYGTIQESVREPAPTKNGFMMSYWPDWPEVWCSLVVENGKRYRERVETLILKDGKVLLYIKGDDYKLPGGGTEPNESMMNSAIRECQEEARITPKNMRYYGSYRGTFALAKSKIRDVYDGFIAHVFVGEYGSKFTGHVNDEDVDREIANNSVFYSLSDVKLKSFHKVAIEQYMKETGYTFREYVSESVKRSELPDDVFGIPQERKYPMPDKKHTISAMKLFNHCEKKYEEQLAKHIIKNIKKYGIDPSFVSSKNRLRKYLEKANLIQEGVIDVEDTNYLLEKMMYEFFGEKPQKSDTDILMEKFFGEASMSEDIKSVPDRIEPMVKKLENKHYRVKYASPGHANTRFENDRNKDGVVDGKLVSTGRIIFERDYHFDGCPDGWEWKTLHNGFRALYVKPFTYSGEDGKERAAFAKWQNEYLANLKKWIEDLPMQDSENPRKNPEEEKKKEEEKE